MAKVISQHSKLYALMFFNLIFLAALIFTLVLTTSDHKCVFPDKKLCFTDLVNEAKINGGYFAELTQKPSYSSDLANDEVVTFSYKINSDESKSFNLVLNYQDNVPASGTNYPNTGSSFSGYEVFTHGVSGGVSIYLKHYATTTSQWNESYKVVNYGVSHFIDTQINIGNCFNAEIDTIYQGFDYITGFYSNNGALPVSSNQTGISSYFNQFKDTDTINLKAEDASPRQYNPFNDFYLYKSSRAWSPNNQPVPLTPSDNSYKCIDPGAINLPSCRSIYIPGKGYKLKDGSYSRNCSNGDAIVEIGNGGTNTPYNNRQGQLLLPLNSATQKIYSGANDAEKSGLANDIRIGPSLVSAVYGSHPDDFSNKLFYPNSIFCGKGNYSSTPEIMYGVSENNSSATVLESFQGSCVANTGPSVNGLFTLGFN